MKLMKNGFTLMELLIVIAVMAIIASVGLGSFTFSLKKGRDAQRKSDLGQVARALESFAIDNKGAYPIDNSVIPWGRVWQVGRTLYMTKVPTDPVATNAYYYVRAENGNGYSLYSTLENDKDAFYDSDGWPSTNCGDSTCRYNLNDGGSSKGQVNE